jgi:hypothetical protein
METTIMLGAQFFGTLLWWIGISLVAERATISAFQKRFVQIMSALLLMAWFAAIPLLAQSGFFRAGGTPAALLLPLILGFFLLFSQTFRKLLTGTPMHWIIGIQVFRVLGGVFLIGYVQGLLPGIFALPAGIGDTLTGITAPFYCTDIPFGCSVKEERKRQFSVFFLRLLKPISEHCSRKSTF